MASDPNAGARRRAVFLDRDGVLLDAMARDGKPASASSIAEMRVLPGVTEACARLKAAGYLLIVVTNQPDIVRGKITLAEVNAMNAALQRQLALDDVRVCPHDDADDCDCRKPKPGLLLAAARDWAIDLAGSVMVGDRWRDIEAGRAAGVRTVFIDYGYDERQPERPDIVTSSLAEVTPRLIADLG